jgi:hypothetical protein
VDRSWHTSSVLFKNPAGPLATAISGLAFGLAFAAVFSFLFGSSWWMLLAVPATIGWWFEWPSRYRAAERRFRRRRTNRPR